jgi:hypothetical protein
MTVPLALGPKSVVMAARDRIDALVDRDRRRAILVSLGCFEPAGDTVSRAKVPTTTAGAELLAAIDALDRACLHGSDEEIEAAGARLFQLWGTSLSTVKIKGSQHD